MNKLYTFALALFSGIILVSCEADSTETNELNRTAPVTGKQLKVVNNSDFKVSGEIFCFGAQANMTVNSDILIMGNATIPANTEITYKNFTQTTNTAYRINPWYVRVNQSAPIAYNATYTNQAYGQLYGPSAGQSKFANWRYLKVELTTTTIPGFVEPIAMFIELPFYSNNNFGETVIDLTPYGLQKDLHISQSSVINASGNTVLTIDSQVLDQFDGN